MDFSRPPQYHPKNEQMVFRLIRTAFTQKFTATVTAHT
jgi:hypothetical protein